MAKIFGFVVRQKYKIMIIFSTIAGGSMVGIGLSKGWNNNKQLMSESMDVQEIIDIPNIDSATQEAQISGSSNSSFAITKPQVADSSDRWTQFSGPKVDYEEKSFGSLKNRDGKNIIISDAKWEIWREQEKGIINDVQLDGSSDDNQLNLWFQTEEFRNAFKKLKEKTEHDGTIWRELCVKNYSTPVSDLHEKSDSNKWKKARDIFAWCTETISR